MAVRNAFYHSVQNLSVFSLLSKNVKIKTYRILSALLYGHKTWSLILREERGLRVFENRVLRRILGSKRDEIIWEWKSYILRSLMICTAHQMLFG